MNGKFRVWDGIQYHYNVALINGIAMMEENPQRSDRIIVNGTHYYSDWAKYKPVKWANENKKGEIVVEFCTGLSAFKSYRGIKPEDLEIYAGDVLTWKWGGKGESVEWDRGGFCVKHSSLGILTDDYDVEIIRTIHEEVKK